MRGFVSFVTFEDDDYKDQEPVCLVTRKGYTIYHGKNLNPDILEKGDRIFTVIGDVTFIRKEEEEDDEKEAEKEEELKPADVIVGPCEECGEAKRRADMRMYDCEGHVTYICQLCFPTVEKKNPQGESDEDVDDFFVPFEEEEENKEDFNKT